MYDGGAEQVYRKQQYLLKAKFMTEKGFLTHCKSEPQFQKVSNYDLT